MSVAYRVTDTGNRSTSQTGVAEEVVALHLLGNASLRGGAIAGVSDPVRDGHGAPGERPDDVRYDGPRKNPPELDEVPGDGGEETTDS